MDLIRFTSDVNITSNSVFNQAAIGNMNATLTGADNADTNWCRQCRKLTGADHAYTNWYR
jgi:hypothetical protein